MSSKTVYNRIFGLLFLLVFILVSCTAAVENFEIRFNDNRTQPAAGQFKLTITQTDPSDKPNIQDQLLFPLQNQAATANGKLLSSSEVTQINHPTTVSP